jgi:hypothetical protein
MFCDTSSCQYVLHESSTDSILNTNIKTITVATARSIKVWAACNSWVVTTGGSGIDSRITIATNVGDPTVQVPPGGINQTTFMTNTTLSCGPGCSIVTAFEASEASPWYYSCNVTVESVTGATLPEHEIGARLRNLASGAIALQGYEVSSFVQDSRFQFQIYPAESIFGTPRHGKTESMAMMMTRFAVGVVAVAAENNGRLTVQGLVPMAGLAIRVEHWNYIHMILLITAGMQLLLGLVAALVASRVVIPCGGPVAVTQVLRSMACRIQSEGISRSETGYPTDSRPILRWIYRDKPTEQDDVYDLYMEEDGRNGRVEPRIEGVHPTRSASFPTKDKEKKEESAR